MLLLGRRPFFLKGGCSGKGGAVTKNQRNAQQSFGGEINVAAPLKQMMHQGSGAKPGYISVGEE